MDPRNHNRHHTAPAPGKRLASGIGGMFNKPINTIRSKAFSRASRHSSGEMTSRSGGHTRQSLSVKSIGRASTQAGKKNEKMERSKTMSFLPVPAKLATKPAPPPPPISMKPKLPLKHAKAVSATRIPSPPRVSFSRPSYLPRSTTHPNLGTIVAGGRRASEYNRRYSGKWPALEDTRPLLRSPLLESPILGTPETDEDWFKVTSSDIADQPSHDNPGNMHSSTRMWNALSTPRYPSISYASKENSLSPRSHGLISSSPPRSPRVIQHHQLLQPIQPITPPSLSMLRDCSASTPVTAAPAFLPSSTSPIRHVFENRQNVPRPTPLVLRPLPMQATFTVDKAQPNAYWSGRFISINDKLLNECFDVDTRPTDENDVDSSNDSTVSLIKNTQMAKSQTLEVRRAEKVFETLDAVCITDEARRSLLIFRNIYAIKTKMLELKCDLPPTPKPEEAKEERLGSSVGSNHGMKSAGLRKMSFMGMLRGRKSSGKSVLSLRE